VTGPTVTDFHDSFSELAIELWSEAKRRRPNQGKRKKYLPRNGGKSGWWTLVVTQRADLKMMIKLKAGEVDTTLLFDVDEVASMPQEETTVAQTESHSGSNAEEIEWSDDPFDCTLRCNSNLIQGSCPFSETNFQDFSRTFPGLRLIFPGL